MFLYYAEAHRGEQENSKLLLYQENLDPPLGGVYHLVVDGKSFAVIREHCPEVMERVSTQNSKTPVSVICCYGDCCTCILLLVAAGERDSVCSNVTRSEGPVGVSPHGHWVCVLYCAPLLKECLPLVTKTFIYNACINSSYGVAMCGDGANDCGVSS